MADERVVPTPENPIPDADEIKPGIPLPAWRDELTVTIAQEEEEPDVNA